MIPHNTCRYAGYVILCLKYSSLVHSSQDRGVWWCTPSTYLSHHGTTICSHTAYFNPHRVIYIVSMLRFPVQLMDECTQSEECGSPYFRLLVRQELIQLLMSLITNS